MRKLTNDDSFQAFSTAEEIVDFMNGRPKDFPGIYILANPGTLDVARVLDACWSTTGGTVEILTTCGELLTYDPYERIRRIRPAEAFT